MMITVYFSLIFVKNERSLWKEKEFI